MEAGAHFIPARKHYVDLRIRPTSAPWMKSRNPLEKIVCQAKRVGLKTRASLSCCRSDVLAAKYPDAVCVNVFGTPSVEQLCPANPDVRGYAAALIEDLSTNYPFETLELSHADFGDGRDLRRYLTRGVTLSDMDRALWSWCFCAACRQRAADAGVDVETASAKARDHLERMFRLDPPIHTTLESLLAAEPSLAAYQRIRIDTVSSLAKSVRSRTKLRLVLEAGAPRPASGADWESLRECMDGFLEVLPGGDGPGPSFEDLVRTAGGPGRVDVLVPCCPPEIRDGPSLVAVVHRATQAGHASIGFDNYGLSAEACLDWARQAIRFAKRQNTA
jgi:hypothetical protein